MATTLIKFPVVSFKKIESPYDNNGTKTYIAVVNVKNVPEDFKEWRKLNPRDPNLNSGVSKQIKATLEDDPDSFFFRNRGITVIAEKITFDNKENVVQLEMADKSRNGLLDGGHTFFIIREHVENLSQEALVNFDAFVKIEIIEGIKDLDEAITIVASRNRSTQVKEQSIEELRQHYDEIKKILKENKPAYEARIAYKEYELADDGSKKDIDIKEILSYLICFDVESFDRKRHPIKAYSQKTGIVEYVKNNRDRLLKYIPLLPQILALRDTIYLDIPAAYNKSQSGKFGKLKGVVEVSNKPRRNKEYLPFLEVESTYQIPSGFIYPILAAFRNLVICDNEKCSWKTDSIKFFQELKHELATRIGEQAMEFRNPNKLGKDTATWGRCYDLVEIETLKRAL